MPGTWWVCPGSECGAQLKDLLFPFFLLGPKNTFSAAYPQICVRLLSSRRPMLYSFQTSLPKLPVPSVPATVQRVRAWPGIPVGRVGWIQRTCPNIRDCPLQRVGLRATGMGLEEGQAEAVPTLMITWLDSTWNLCGPCWMTRNITEWRCWPRNSSTRLRPGCRSTWYSSHGGRLIM